MIIHVTQAHIDAGEAAHCCLCPVALALREATGREWKVSGSLAHLDYLTWIILSHSVRDFIYDFDAGRPVAPFSFRFDWSDLTAPVGA